MSKKKLLACLTFALLVSCGSGGGGGGPAVTGVTPGTGNGNVTPPTTNPGSNLDTNVNIGVIDSGFTPLSSQLKGRINILEGFESGSDTSHGDSVAEVIIGKDKGIARGNDKINLLAIGASKTCASGTGDCISINSEMYKGLYNKGVRIYNQSFGDSDATHDITNIDPNEISTSDPLYAFLLEKASTDSLFIWAAGNNSKANPTVDGSLPYRSEYKAAEKGWLTVVAVDENDNLTNFSNMCGLASNWCIGAPGIFEFSDRRIGHGTSFAAPIVSATAAMIQHKYPWMDASLIRQTILSTATSKGNPGNNTTYGWGILNIDKALNGPALFSKRLALADHVTADVTSGVYEFSNDISGDAGIIKRGKGTLKLTGHSTFTGTTKVEAGVLHVNGTTKSPTSVKATASLVSNGGLFESDIVNEGTVISEGKGFKVAGNFISMTNSNITADAGAKIDVKGKAILDNTNLTIKNPIDENDNPIYVDKNGITNTIISAEQGIESTFSSTNTSPFLNADVTYDENNVTVDVTRKDHTKELDATYGSDITINNVAENIETLFQSVDNGNGDSDTRAKVAKLQSVSEKELYGTMYSLSGQIYGSAQALTFQQSKTINKTLSNRLVTLGQLENKSNVASVWIDGFATTGELKRDGYASADTNVAGTQIGVDKFFSDSLVLGASVSYSKSDADFNKYAGKSDATNLSLSVYGRYANSTNPFYISGRLGVGFVDSKVERRLTLTNELVDISHDDVMFSGYAEAGYGLRAGSIKFTPYVGLSHDSLQRGDFKENGSILALQADKKNYNQTSGLVGFRAETSFNSVLGRSHVQGYVSWQKAFDENDLDFEASFIANPNSKFTVKGIGLSEETTWAGLGIMTEVSNNWGWSLNYDAAFEKNSTKDNVFTLGVRYNFD